MRVATQSPCSQRAGTFVMLWTTLCDIEELSWQRGRPLWLLKESLLPIKTELTACDRGWAQWRPTSNGRTSEPPDSTGFDGSKCSRNSRFRTSERASRNASFRLSAFRSATLKKASPK